MSHGKFPAPTQFKTPALKMFGAALLFVCSSCEVRTNAGARTHPSEFAGVWEHHIAIQSAFDTLRLLPDGSVKGGPSIPESAYWYVSTPVNGEPTLCMGDNSAVGCDKFVVSPDSIKLLRDTVVTVTLNRIGNL